MDWPSAHWLSVGVWLVPGWPTWWKRPLNCIWTAYLHISEMHLTQGFCVCVCTDFSVNQFHCLFGATDSRYVAVECSRYWMQFDWENAITFFKLWTHKWHLLPRHYRLDKGCPLWDFGENLPWYIGSALYSQNSLPLFVWTESVVVVADTFVLWFNKRYSNWIEIDLKHYNFHVDGLVH